MIAGKNASRASLTRNRTVSFTMFANRAIDGFVLAYGNDIPDFRAKLVKEMQRTWPYWKSSWVDLPSEGTAADGTSKSLTALIKFAYAQHRPGWVITYTVEKGRPTGTWRVTDDLNELREVFGITLSDNLGRFSNDMEGTSLMASAAFQDDAIMQFFISGERQVYKDMISLYNETVRTVDDINVRSVSWLRGNFGWQDVNDAIDTLETRSGVRGRATREVGEALWQQYDRKVP